MEMAELSIIIPIYNNADYLQQTIQTVLQQTYKEFELLLIDDGSTDQSLSICHHMAEQDERIRVIHKENSGVSSSRNCGIDAATGTYIAFVDADDCIDSVMYEMMIHTLKKSKSDFVGCCVIKENEYKPLAHVKSKGLTSYKPLELLSKKGYFMDSSLNKVYLRKFIGTTRFDESISYSEDKLFVSELLLKAEKVVLLSNMFYHYIQRKNSLSWQNSATIWEGNFKANKRIYEKINTMNVDDILRQSVFRGYAKAIIALLRFDIRYRHEKEYNETIAAYGDIIDTFLKTTKMSWCKRMEYKTYVTSYGLASLIHYYAKGGKKHE
jgi:glycosyltransferase involved in cell wall biosynthesis